MTIDFQTADSQPLDALAFPLWGTRLIEASAGTGKTYTIANLYVRLVLGHGELGELRSLTPPDILVVTFTRAATQELRDRIRRRLTEAARFFLQEHEGDDFLVRLRDDYPDDRWPACARVLMLAADWMDDAAVSTIDAWCYRMLREHAFDSASLFEVELDVEAMQRVEEATRDYWRLFIAPLSPSDFGRVLQVIDSQKIDKRQATDCDSLASILYRKWLRAADSSEEPLAPAKVLAEVHARISACKEPWIRWAPEIRQLLQDAYDAGHFHKARLRHNSWTEWLSQLEAWAADPDARQPFDARVKAWDRLTPGGLAEVWKNGIPPQHPAFDAMVRLRDEIVDCDAHAVKIFPHAAWWVSRRIAEIRRQRAMLDFDGLLDRLDAALKGANGARLAHAIRTQFPAALIDEFQDTNPVQYRIFDRIYDVEDNSETALLALIGDPKQAIYRFRGADIHSYLEARRACSGRLYTLDSNYRSSPAMVNAVNHLFHTAEQSQEEGAFLFRTATGISGHAEDPVPFSRVKAAAKPGKWQVDGVAGPAMTIWLDTSHDKRGACAEAVAQSCASEILRLLQLGAQGRAGFQSGVDFVPLKARDIAVLVNNRGEAAMLRGELARRGIRSVYLSDDSSVYQSPAAQDVLAWLRACAEPENAGYVRAALATATLDLSWSDLDAFVGDEVLWEATLERFAKYKEQWRTRGVLPLLRTLMNDFAVPARLFAAQESGEQEGERHLTDLLHLAELLQEASSRLDGEHALIRDLEEHLDAAANAAIDGDVSRMRLESDAGLVQVVTVHKSKGLEYPLVFYPHAYQARPVDALESPVLYRGEDGTNQWFVHPHGIDESRQAEIRGSLERERLAEDIRKLYVALTRARHATWVALAPVDTMPACAFGYLLGGKEACTPDMLESSLASLAEGCDDIVVCPFSPVLHRRLVNVSETPVPATWRTMRRRIEQRWAMSSYSALARIATERQGDEDAPFDTVAPLDEAQLDAYLEAYAADSDRYTEAPGPRHGAGMEAGGIHAFPRGATPGSFLHALLEWVSKRGAHRALADSEKLRQTVLRRCQSRGWQSHAAALADWLSGFFTQQFRIAPPDIQIRTPIVLADLSAALPEMEFWFGVRDADLPTVDRLVRQYFVADRPRSMITRGTLNGMLRGFVDLAFEHEGRYYVADYKSNWLGPDDTFYTASAMQQAVLEHRYDLQSAIYLYALHRLLKSRLGQDYDYDRHIGGAVVFFVRGCNSETQGLHIERPPREAIESLESIFDASLSGVFS